MRLAEAQLTQPGRIDAMARQLGLTEPQPGQVVHATTHIDAGAPVLAQVNRSRPASTDSTQLFIADALSRCP